MKEKRYLLGGANMAGSWIFLSHSSKDIQIVRRIRNEFEECGHNPLAFHLKCLDATTDSGRKEIFELLKREIDAREWFVFCESEHSHQSEYVNYERNYIHQSGKSNIWTLDVTQQWDKLKKQIDRISKDLKIYIEYVDADADTVKPLIVCLEQHDFTVWTPQNYMNYHGDIWKDAIQCGLFIMFISKHTHYPALLGEVEYITNQINCGEFIIPVFITGYSFPIYLPQFSFSDVWGGCDFESWFRSGPSFDIPENAEPEDYASLVTYIEHFYIQRILKT